MKESADKVFRVISRLSSDAECTEEELKDAIRAEGGDPDDFVRRNLPRIAELVDERREHQSHEKGTLQAIFGDDVSEVEEFNREQAIELIQKSLQGMHEEQLRAILEIIHTTEHARH